VSDAAAPLAGSTGTAVDSEAVTQLVLRERQTRDRGWYDEMTNCFTSDATIAMSWFNGPASVFIASTKARTTEGVWGRHRLSPPTVRVHGDRALAELPLGIEFAIDIDGTPADLVSYCRSQYRAVRTDDGWKISGITSVYERDTLTPSVPGDSISLGSGTFSGLRPSYRCLAWYFEQQGTPLPDDLLGDDQPAAVDALYRRERLWLQNNFGDSVD
jgi:hypothetical protein